MVHTTGNQTHVKILLCLLARQRPSIRWTGHCWAATLWNSRFNWTRSLASKFTRPQSRRLSNLGYDAKPSLPDSNTRHRGPEAALHHCLGWTETECCWQGNWSVATKAEGLCSCQGKALRTTSLINHKTLIKITVPHLVDNFEWKGISFYLCQKLVQQCCWFDVSN